MRWVRERDAAAGFGMGVGGFGGRCAASSAALGGSAGEHDEQDADDLDDRGFLVQYEQPEDNAEGGFERHQGPERSGRHAAQGKHFQRERQDGEEDGQPDRGGDAADCEVAAGLWNADDGCRHGGDGNGEGESPIPANRSPTRWVSKM